jgi:hypothetical protein
MQETRMKVVEEEKDMGVIVHSSLKPTQQCQKAAKTGLGVLHQLRKNFHFPDRHVFVRLYKQYVRPHLEFATPVWSLWQQADKQVLEKVQQKFVNMIAGLPNGTYEEKCAEIGLETLEERRNMQDMAQVFKMIRGNEKLSRIPMFNHVDGVRTRQDADELNLKQGNSRLEIRKNFLHKELSANGTRSQKKLSARKMLQDSRQLTKNLAADQVECRKHVAGDKTEKGRPPDSTDGPTMPPPVATGFYP